MKLHFQILIIVAVTVCGNTYASVVTFQDGVSGYSGTESTYLKSSDDVNHSSETVMTVAGSTDYALVRFSDIFGALPGQIATGSTINSATLTLSVNQNGGPVAGANPFSNNTYDVWNPVLDWDVNTVTYSGYLGGPATWTATGNDCTLGSCAMKDVIDQSVNHGSFVPNATPISLSITALVQSWSTDPVSNFGLLIGDIDGNNVDYAAFHTEEATGIAFRPSLQIDYTTVDVPTPATFGVFLIGLLSLSVRRKTGW